MSKVKKKVCKHLKIKNVESWKMPEGNSVTQKCLDCGMIRYVQIGKFNSYSTWRKV